MRSDRGGRPAPFTGRAGRLKRLLFAVTWLLLAAPALGADEPPGVFLVAAPSIEDPRFSRSVILLKRHARGGTVGVIVNRPSSTEVTTLYPESHWLQGHQRHLFDGGPEAPSRAVFLVRTRSHAPRNALRVFDNVFLGHDPQLLHDILAHPRPLLGVRVFRGHVRWFHGQLEREIVAGAWYLAEADVETLFDSDPERLWQRLIDRIGDLTAAAGSAVERQRPVVGRTPGDRSRLPIRAPPPARSAATAPATLRW